MTRMAAVRLACLALVALGLAACPPVTTKTPVGTTVTAAPDLKLAGLWKGRVAGAATDSYFTFWPEADGTMRALLVTPPMPKDAGGSMAFRLQTVALGKNHYMNVRETLTDDKTATGPMADRTFPVLYRLAGDTLTLAIVDEGAARRAIKAGKLAGAIAEGQAGDVVLTSPPGPLDAFFAGRAARALFPSPLVVLHRVR